MWHLLRSTERPGDVIAWPRRTLCRQRKSRTTSAAHLDGLNASRTKSAARLDEPDASRAKSGTSLDGPDAVRPRCAAQLTGADVSNTTSAMPRDEPDASRTGSRVVLVVLVAFALGGGFIGRYCGDFCSWRNAQVEKDNRQLFNATEEAQYAFDDTLG